MAKKSEVLEPELNTKLPSPNVVPELELKISKQDIIDAMIDEQEEKIEEELEEIQENQLPLFAKIQEAWHTAEEATKEAARKDPELLKKIEALKLFTGLTEVKEGLGGTPVNSRNKKEKQVLPIFACSDMRDRYYYDKKLGPKITKILTDFPRTINDNAALVFTAGNTQEDDGTFGQVTFPLVPTLVKQEKYLEALELDKEYAKNKERIDELELAKSKLRKMGSRAKSKLVKDLLGQTDQGKGILQSMESGKTAKQITKLLASKKSSE